jgi:hypothetical protein
MKRYHWPKIAGAGIVALSLTILPLALPASAQNLPDNTNRDRTSPVTNTAPLPENRYYDRDAVWLGAIGLLSLALLLNAYERTEN